MRTVHGHCYHDRGAKRTLPDCQIVRVDRTVAGGVAIGFRHVTGGAEPVLPGQKIVTIDIAVGVEVAVEAAAGGLPSKAPISIRPSTTRPNRAPLVERRHPIAAAHRRRIARVESPRCQAAGRVRVGPPLSTSGPSRGLMPPADWPIRLPCGIGEADRGLGQAAVGVVADQAEVGIDLGTQQSGQIGPRSRAVSATIAWSRFSEPLRTKMPPPVSAWFEESYCGRWSPSRWACYVAG